MQLDITGRHIEVTDALRQHVVNKVSKIEDHFDLVTNIHCILTVEKLQHKAEATINADGKRIYADATDDNMYVAIDTLAHKLNRRVRKHKEKLKKHH
jgi:putative sigma-54 modulation protein